MKPESDRSQGVMVVIFTVVVVAIVLYMLDIAGVL
jgi:hypothetical protein